MKRGHWCKWGSSRELHLSRRQSWREIKRTERLVVSLSFLFTIWFVPPWCQLASCFNVWHLIRGYSCVSHCFSTPSDFVPGALLQMTARSSLLYVSLTSVSFGNPRLSYSCHAAPERTSSRQTLAYTHLPFLFFKLDGFFANCNTRGKPATGLWIMKCARSNAPAQIKRTRLANADHKKLERCTEKLPC